MKASQGQPNPEKNIEEFANLLISKLQAVKKSREDEKLLKQKLNQVGDGDSSVASAGPYTVDPLQKKRHQHQVRPRSCVLGNSLAIINAHF
jgi:hypothetical protein